MNKRPWWRHWHVTYHDPGYTLTEAKDVQRYEEEHNPEYGPFDITRCDIDHSLHNPVITHITESEARVLDGNR